MWVASSKDAAHISVGEDRGIAEVTLEQYNKPYALFQVSNCSIVRSSSVRT